LAVIVTCFTEKGWTGTPNPLDYSIWDVFARTCLWRKCEPFANLKDLQNVIRDNLDKWHNVDDQTMTFWCGLMRTSDDMNDELLANITRYVTLFHLYHG